MAATDQMQEKAQEVAHQAREKTQETTGEARNRLRAEVDQRSTQAGERLSSSGSDLRSVGEELRKQGKDAPARYAEQAAERIERAGGYLTRSDGERILRDVEDFGRRQPLAVLAGGMMLGIVAARFLKASSSRRYQSQTGLSNGAHAGQAGALAAQNPVATPPVQPAMPDPGEHHQRFEGHS